MGTGLIFIPSIHLPAIALAKAGVNPVKKTLPIEQEQEYEQEYEQEHGQEHEQEHEKEHEQEYEQEHEQEYEQGVSLCLLFAHAPTPPCPRSPTLPRSRAPVPPRRCFIKFSRLGH